MGADLWGGWWENAELNRGAELNGGSNRIKSNHIESIRIKLNKVKLIDYNKDFYVFTLKKLLRMD